MLNPFILILLIQLRVLVGVKILSAGLHLAVLCPNQSVIRLQITISEEFLAATTASSLLCFAAPAATDSCLTIFIFFLCNAELLLCSERRWLDFSPGNYDK